MVDNILFVIISLYYTFLFQTSNFQRYWCFPVLFILLFTLALIILSYTYVIRTILRIPSTTQRTKAFSTCSSHMIVISISYGSCIFMCVNPSAKDRVSLSKGVAVLNTSVAPMLNPFIYTLTNQQVKRAFLDMERKAMFFSRK